VVFCSEARGILRLVQARGQCKEGGRGERSSTEVDRQGEKPQDRTAHSGKYDDVALGLLSHLIKRLVNFDRELLA
jgi:hypothetical protein